MKPVNSVEKPHAIDFWQFARRRLSRTLTVVGGLCIVAALDSSYITLAQAQTNPGPGVCLGYHPEFNVWGQQWAWPRARPRNERGVFQRFCPQGYAFYEIDDPASSAQLGEAIIPANCCPLPFSDILTEEHQMTRGSCPPNSVITGMEYPTIPVGGALEIRCTTINTDKYSLSTPLPGAYWGVGRNMNTIGTTKKLKKGEIPAAIRSAVGRMSRFRWDEDGCIGYPVGSLLVGLGVVSCNEFTFSRLFHNDGTLVEMFADCVGVSDVFEPGATCVHRKEQKSEEPK